MQDSDFSAAFAAYYMQRATRELAEDLDAVRAASDFNDKSVSLLIEALRQGTTTFSPAEQRRIVEAGDVSQATEKTVVEADEAPVRDELKPTEGNGGEQAEEGRETTRERKRKAKGPKKGKKSR